MSTLLGCRYAFDAKVFLPSTETLSAQERAATCTCKECEDEFCEACFWALHRKGEPPRGDVESSGFFRPCMPNAALPYFHATGKRTGHTQEPKEPVKAGVLPRSVAPSAADPSINDEDRPLENLELLALERNSPQVSTGRANGS